MKTEIVITKTATSITAKQRRLSYTIIIDKPSERMLFENGIKYFDDEFVIKQLGYCLNAGMKGNIIEYGKAITDRAAQSFINVDNQWAASKAKGIKNNGIAAFIGCLENKGII